MNIILIGFKGSGKTTAGQLFAEKINFNFVDIDYLVLENFKANNKNNFTEDFNIQNIYKNLGEYKFRKLEEEVISNINELNNTVIATGGGSVLSSNNQKKISELGSVIYLQSSPQDLFARMEKNKILPEFIDSEKPFSSFYAIYSERVKLYENIANYTLDVSQKKIDEITDELVSIAETMEKLKVSTG